MARTIDGTWNRFLLNLSYLTLRDFQENKAGLNTLKKAVESQPTLTPPNEPLTLEQLREMDGEPVWIVDVGPHKWYGPGWAIVDRDNCLVRTVKNWNAVFFESYGERWLAYRRQPEGEA